MLSASRDELQTTNFLVITQYLLLMLRLADELLSMCSLTDHVSGNSPGRMLARLPKSSRRLLKFSRN